MKHAVPFALLAATLAFTGCNTYVGVDNPDQPSSTYSNATGSLVTRYKASTEAVFNAVKRAVDSQSDTMKRMGESDKRVNNELQEVTVFARAIGDLEIKIDVEKVEDPVTKENLHAGDRQIRLLRQLRTEPADRLPHHAEPPPLSASGGTAIGRRLAFRLGGVLFLHQHLPRHGQHPRT